MLHCLTRILLRLLDLTGMDPYAAYAGYIYCHMEQAVSVITKGWMWDEITHMEIKRANPLTKCTLHLNTSFDEVCGHGIIV